ncbi:MAG TPA: TfoX/Sxy family protein, partial [Burkholderiaceae bacterium]
MNDAGFVEHCLELLSPLGPVRARRMFGGHGVYVDDLFVAIIIEDVLYLKVDDVHRPAFQAAGCRDFSYETRHGERHALSFWTAPEEAMESPAEMRAWGRRAMAAAV